MKKRGNRFRLPLWKFIQLCVTDKQSKMSEILLRGITVEELIEKLRQVIDVKTDKIKAALSQPDHENLITRKEVAQLLRISLPTLNEWTKIKKLQSYKIGNRVLYKRNEVIASLNSGITQKNKRL